MDNSVGLKSSGALGIRSDLNGEGDDQKIMKKSQVEYLNLKGNIW